MDQKPPKTPSTPGRKKTKKKAKPPKTKEFNLSGPSAIPQYNPLLDEHLGHFFRSRVVQRTLLDSGLIDRYGRIIDIERNKGRLNIIEQEFRNAERAEELRRKEEEEARRRRQQQLEEHRRELQRLERIRQIKEDERARHERFMALHEEIGLATPRHPTTPRGASRASMVSRAASRATFHATSDSPYAAGAAAAAAMTPRAQTARASLASRTPGGSSGALTARTQHSASRERAAAAAVSLPGIGAGRHSSMGRRSVLSDRLQVAADTGDLSDEIDSADEELLYSAVPDFGAAGPTRAAAAAAAAAAVPSIAVMGPRGGSESLRVSAAAGASGGGGVGIAAAGAQGHSAFGRVEGHAAPTPSRSLPPKPLSAR